MNQIKCGKKCGINNSFMSAQLKSLEVNKLCCKKHMAIQKYHMLHCGIRFTTKQPDYLGYFVYTY